MRITARVGIVLAILALAVAAAMPFRRRITSQAEVQDTPDRTIERRVRSRGPDGWSRQISATPLPTQPLQVPAVSGTNESRKPSDVPELPPSYRRSFSPVGALLKPVDGSNDELHRATDQPHLLKPKFDTGSQSLTHKIVDGDTLAALSQKYLGSTAQWREIFELNRDVLKSPDLLPIGRAIKIPSRDKTAKAASSQVEPTPALVPLPRDAFSGE